MQNKIIVDSREKKNQHILRWFLAHGIDYEIKKLDIADYRLSDRENLVVDRKQNLDELIHNLFGKDKRRFYNEVRLAYKNKVKVVIVCEHSAEINSIGSVARFQSKHSKISGQDLRREIERVRLSYGVDFVFCDKPNTAETISKILGVRI